MKQIILSVLVLFSVVCKGQNGPQISTASDLNFEKIGWILTTPAGWNLTQNMQYGNATNLITLMKDNFNSFIANSSAFDSSKSDWNSYVRQIDSVTASPFSAQGIRFDTLSEVLKIDNLSFGHFRVRLYSVDGVLIMTTDTYSRLIDGNAFFVTISYNNEADRNILNDVLFNSRFSIRN